MSDQTTAVDTQTPPESGIQLQLADLLLAAQVINLASQRGAFKAEEFTQVGGLYDRLVTFLKESGALKPAQSAETEASAEESTAE